jgi:hypothetical protein
MKPGSEEKRGNMNQLETVRWQALREETEAEASEYEQFSGEVTAVKPVDEFVMFGWRMRK